jgi:hypothetical protein
MGLFELTCVTCIEGGRCEGAWDIHTMYRLSLSETEMLVERLRGPPAYHDESNSISACSARSEPK